MRVAKGTFAVFLIGSKDLSFKKTGQQEKGEETTLLPAINLWAIENVA
jgi:hypothetical protein